MAVRGYRPRRAAAGVDHDSVDLGEMTHIGGRLALASRVPTPAPGQPICLGDLPMGLCEESGRDGIGWDCHDSATMPLSI